MPTHDNAPIAEVWARPDLLAGKWHDAAVGEIAKMRVLTKLVEHGHEIAVPYPDMGDDIWIDCRYRLQVKSASKPQVMETGSSQYFFCISHRQGLARLSADFFIFVGLDHDLYWIVPRSVLVDHGVKRALAITTDPNRKRARRTGFSAAAWEWFDRWDVLA